MTYRREGRDALAQVVLQRRWIGYIGLGTKQATFANLGSVVSQRRESGIE